MEKLKEILGVVLAAAILLALFFIPGRDWRKIQQKFIESSKAASDSLGDARLQNAVPDEVRFIRSLDSLDIGSEQALDSLAVLIEYSRMHETLGAIEDSLDRMEKSLETVREYLLSLREEVASRQNENLSRSARSDYFAAVRYLDRLSAKKDGFGRKAQKLENESRVLKRLIDTPDKSFSGFLDSNHDGTEIHWLMPELVPVRELCTSCHLLEDELRVMLNPDNEGQIEYPSVMLEHPPRKFGCTVCHNGRPVELDNVSSHGHDYQGRPFLGGKSAYTKCGFCHADLDQISFLSFERTSMPDECRECHAAEDWSHSAPDSLFADDSALIGDDSNVRQWLLRHWAEKTGSVPTRENLEATLVVLIAGGTPAVSDSTGKDSASSVQGGEKLLCPRCRRTFIRGTNMAGRQMRCPIDGELLVEPD